MTVPAGNSPKFLLDLNIILDLLLARAPWHLDAAVLLDRIEKGRAKGYVAAHTITTIYYIVKKSRDASAARQAVADILKIVEVVPLSSNDFQQALILGLDDFEDAVQVAAGMAVGADWVVTRNEKDFKRAAIPVISCVEAISRT